MTGMLPLVRVPPAEPGNALAPLPVLPRPLSTFTAASPECVTLLPTYRCNAACAECCFESNPRIKHRMTREDLLGVIDRLPHELPGVRYVVLSGGEVTLLREDLIDAIARLTELGYGSRIVSNGHWGRSDHSADWWVTRLREAGLGELNLSTGDEHQQWVPVDSVARSALYATRAGLTTLITVEGKDTARVRAEDIRSHPMIREILSAPESRGRFMLMTNVWMPFHSDTDITNDAAPAESTPCDNVFDNFVVSPHGNLMSCCGLTMEYIPELKVGNIDSDASLRGVYSQQYADLLKLWIWLDGTRHIWELAVKRGNLTKPLLSPHMCSICAQIYKDPDIRLVVAELVEENAEQILFRAAIKARITARVATEPHAPTSRLPEEDTRSTSDMTEGVSHA